MTKPTVITDEDFETEVLNSETPVLVDFWAEWCGPCRALAPTIEELSEEYEGRLKFTKLNVDENPVSASTYGIRSIPTLIIFVGGIEKDRILGALPKKNIAEAIQSTLEHRLSA